MLEKLHQFRNQPRRQGASFGQQRVRIDAEICQVIAERAQSYLAVGVHVPLADLKKPAEWLEQAEILPDRLASERVQDDVDAFSLRNTHHLVGKIARARIKDMVGTKKTHDVALFRRSGAAEDFRATAFRNLDSRHADPAGRAVNEHAF